MWTSPLVAITILVLGCCENTQCWIITMVALLVSRTIDPFTESDKIVTGILYNCCENYPLNICPFTWKNAELSYYKNNKKNISLSGFSIKSSTWPMMLNKNLWIKFMYRRWWTFLVAQMVKNLPAKQEMQVPSLHWEDPLKKGVATHSNVLAWRIPWTKEPGGLQSIESQRGKHYWVTNTDRRWWKIQQ